MIWDIAIRFNQRHPKWKIEQLSFLISDCKKTRCLILKFKNLKSSKIKNLKLIVSQSHFLGVEVYGFKICLAC